MEKGKKRWYYFAMIREGYGKKNPNQIDKCFYSNLSGAKSAGSRIYYYSYATTVQDVVEEAQFCIENIKG